MHRLLRRERAANERRQRTPRVGSCFRLRHDLSLLGTKESLEIRTRSPSYHLGSVYGSVLSADRQVERWLSQGGCYDASLAVPPARGSGFHFGEGVAPASRCD